MNVICFALLVLFVGVPCVLSIFKVSGECSRNEPESESPIEL